MPYLIYKLYLLLHSISYVLRPQLLPESDLWIFLSVLHHGIVLKLRKDSRTDIVIN
jgi:hypothetical protein